MNSDKQNSPVKYIIVLTICIVTTILAIIFYYSQYDFEKAIRTSPKSNTEQPDSTH